jgi:prepilin-type N-terminal cleavage/methylation domain-containing protein
MTASVTQTKSKRGFTLLEIIVASVILCGAVLTLGAISTGSLNATRLNRQYEVAASLADKQLTMIDYIGVEEFIQSGKNQGLFKGLQPQYHWQVQTESTGIDALYRIKVIVSWTENSRSYNLSTDTMLNGKGSTVTTVQK